MFNTINNKKVKKLEILSSGNKSKIYGITKRGDSYLRKQLIHGARTVVSHAQNKQQKNQGANIS
jgi:transposase